MHRISKGVHEMTKKKYPDKLFYKIGEVCKITETQPYVLRFWESEFSQLAPKKNRAGQRVYRKDEIDLIFKIKELLYDEEYTIAGARKKLGMSDTDDGEQREFSYDRGGRKRSEQEDTTDQGELREKLRRVDEQLRSLLITLDGNDRKIREIEAKLKKE